MESDKPETPSTAARPLRATVPEYEIRLPQKDRPVLYHRGVEKGRPSGATLFFWQNFVGFTKHYNKFTLSLTKCLEIMAREGLELGFDTDAKVYMLFRRKAFSEPLEVFASGEDPMQTLMHGIHTLEKSWQTPAPQPPEEKPREGAS